MGSLATNQMIIALLFTMAFAKAELSTSHILKGSVSCLDCSQGSDLSGIQVLIKCDRVKKLAVAHTEEDGTFETELPTTNEPKSTSGINCMAKILGGPYQLYTKTKNYATVICQDKESGHFTISKPLNFYKSCPLKGKSGAKNMGFCTSKTVDLPLPREWGLAPSSYYVNPFIPIIGIP